MKKKSFIQFVRDYVKMGVVVRVVGVGLEEGKGHTFFFRRTGKAKCSEEGSGGGG